MHVLNSVRERERVRERELRDGGRVRGGEVLYNRGQASKRPGQERG